MVLFNAVLAGVKNFEVPMADMYSAFQGRDGLLLVETSWSRFLASAPD